MKNVPIVQSSTSSVTTCFSSELLQAFKTFIHRNDYLNPRLKGLTLKALLATSEFIQHAPYQDPRFFWIRFRPSPDAEQLQSRISIPFFEEKIAVLDKMKAISRDPAILQRGIVYENSRRSSGVTLPLNTITHTAMIWYMVVTASAEDWLTDPLLTFARYVEKNYRLDGLNPLEVYADIFDHPHNSSKAPEPVNPPQPLTSSGAQQSLPLEFASGFQVDFTDQGRIQLSLSISPQVIQQIARRISLLEPLPA